MMPPGKEDFGHLLENIVYLELRRRGLQVSYFSGDGDREVDFFVQSHSGREELVQVCASLSDPDTRQRELRAIEEACRALRVDRATIVTLWEHETTDVGGHSVRAVPAWRWLLESVPDDTMRTAAGSQRLKKPTKR